MATNINNIQGNLRAINNRVLVTEMHFGEQTTTTGIVISNDDGKTRGIYPRWGKVYSKGTINNDVYAVGNWILVEHGRWTRGINLEANNTEFEVRMVETESILAYSVTAPNSLNMGAEYRDGEHATVDPSSFINPQY